MNMLFAEYIASKLEGIGYGLLTTLLFCVLPIGVAVIGYFIVQKRKKDNRSTLAAVILAVIAELLTLIPLIGVLFFSEDGILFLFFVPINVIGTTFFLLPVILPVISVIIITRKKSNNESLVLPVIFSAIAEILILIFDIWWIMKDYQ